MAKAEGIPPTASVVVPGPSLNYLGNTWAYAFSGNIQVSTSPVEHLSFVSGDGFIVGTLSVQGSVGTDITDGNISVFDVTFNSVTVYHLKISSTNEQMPSTLTVEILIPPFTEVIVTGDSDSSGAGYFTRAVIVGRVYGIG